LRLVKLYQDYGAAQNNVARSEKLIAGVEREIASIEPILDSFKFKAADILRYQEAFPQALIQELKPLHEELSQLEVEKKEQEMMAIEASLRAEDAAEQVRLYRKMYASAKIDLSDLPIQVAEQNKTIQKWANRYTDQLACEKYRLQRAQEIGTKIEALEGQITALENKALNPELLQTISHPALAERAMTLLYHLCMKIRLVQENVKNRNQLADRQKTLVLQRDRLEEAGFILDIGVVQGIAHPEIQCSYEKLETERKATRIFLLELHQLTKTFAQLNDEQALADLKPKRSKETSAHPEELPDASDLR